MNANSLSAERSPWLSSSSAHQFKPPLQAESVALSRKDGEGVTSSLRPGSLAANPLVYAKPSAGVSDESGSTSTESAARDEGRAPESTETAEKKSESPAAGSRAEQGLSAEELASTRQLKARDREVRQHEAAHQAVGGQYAGAVSYSYQRGPDGILYAVGGEVPIDIAPVANDPQATIDKMRVVRAAALAPAQPSAQDLQVAAAATQMQLQAQVELAANPQALRERARAPETSEAGQAEPEPEPLRLSAAATYRKVDSLVQLESPGEALHIEV